MFALCRDSSVNRTDLRVIADIAIYSLCLTDRREAFSKSSATLIIIANDERIA
jgi:hypothetical protein